MPLIVLLASLLVPGEPSTPARTEAKKHENVTYAVVDGVKLQLDLVVPEKPGPHPLVVCFHGGAWVAGNRKDLTKPALFNPGGSDGTKDVAVLENLVKQGYAAATVSYRLAPKHRFPAQIEDAKAAIKFLRKNAKKYDLDGEHFGVMGFSAGGHLALLLGTTREADGYEGTLYPDTSSAVQCVIDYFGPSDLCLYRKSPGVVETFLVPLCGKECKTNDEVLKKASPINYLHDKAAPTLLIHGTMDLVVPYIHSEKLHEAMEDKGIPTKLVPIRWKGHGWEDPDATQTAAKETLAFLKKHLADPEAKTK